MVTHPIAVAVFRLGFVLREGIGMITDAVAIAVFRFVFVQREGIGMITDAIAIAVFRLVFVQREGIGMVTDAITIAILRLGFVLRESIGSITDAIAVTVCRFGRVVREGIGGVRHPITIAIVIFAVGYLVAIQIGRLARRVQRIGSQAQLVDIGPTIVVVIQIGVVTATILIGIDRFAALLRESIIGIRHAISISVFQQDNRLLFGDIDHGDAAEIHLTAVRLLPCNLLSQQGNGLAQLLFLTLLRHLAGIGWQQIGQEPGAGRQQYIIVGQVITIQNGIGLR